MIRSRAVLGLAVASGLASAEEVELWTRGPDPDPFEGLTPDERIEYAIAHAGSGVWSTCPPMHVELDDGRVIAIAPPGHRPRRSAAPQTAHVGV